MNRCAFLDRDGTLIKAYDGRPANTVDEVELLPGVDEGLTILKEAGYLLIVCSNQGGISLGYITHEVVAQQHARLNELLREASAPQIDDFYYCPHGPKDGCGCRKPLPTMVYDAATKYGISLKDSLMVGDHRSDIEAASAARLGGKYLVLSDRFTHNHGADRVFESLKQAAEFITMERRLHV
jgi:D-glycero-D-manno-heptose 1,7-bisphosphate phosphatase